MATSKVACAHPRLAFTRQLLFQSCGASLTLEHTVGGAFHHGHQPPVSCKSTFRTFFLTSGAKSISIKHGVRDWNHVFSSCNPACCIGPSARTSPRASSGRAKELCHCLGSLKAWTTRNFEKLKFRHSRRNGFQKQIWTTPLNTNTRHIEKTDFEKLILKNTRT